MKRVTFLIIFYFFIGTQFCHATTKILIVPGHDLFASGAEFRGVKEADLTLKLGYDLYNYLKKDKNFDVSISRAPDGQYSKWFKDYVKSSSTEILVFENAKHIDFKSSIAGGEIKAVDGVSHNVAPPATIAYLTAINKYANDHNVDLVLHLHFNDYPRKRDTVDPGDHSGFAIYVPEHQFSNATDSFEFAKYLKKRLLFFEPGSDLPGESNIIVEDQNLIAVGVDNERDGASVLVEYAYMYEPFLRFKSLQSLALNEFAFQTYMAILDRYASSTLSEKLSVSTSILPYKFKKQLSLSSTHSVDVLALQMALREDGIYPPIPRTFSDCPISGKFGECTQDSLVIFQQKYLGISTGVVGPMTLRLLNKRFGK